MMAAALKLKKAFNRLKSVFSLQKSCNSVAEGASGAGRSANSNPNIKSTGSTCVDVDTSKWKKMDSRALGIRLSMFSHASRIVVRVLQNEGHDAYLVGGCVRDLLLNKIPKDFDVITTANLQEIKKKFHRALIVGRRFPICMVHIMGSEIEVSSFETVARHKKGKEKVPLPEVPKGYDEKDLLRWENSLHRDFTVNSMFYDPFAHKIYDYSNGMADLTAMKLRTVVPAYSSFQEDRARILRGLRIAARLGFSFANDTEKAVLNLCSSVQNLDKARLMMEMNYMLSYGAAQSSLILLKKFHLLDILLPFQAAYLADSAGQTPVMLMNLLSNLDNVVSCDQPCDSVLWISLLVFHLALVNNPQDARVVWTFSSVLYHGSWKEGVKAAREFSEEDINYVPEIFNSFDDITDEQLQRRVSQFASIVLDSLGAWTDSKSLCKLMGRNPSSACADAVFTLSKNAVRGAAEIFNVLVKDIKSLKKKRQCYGIDYEFLGKGDVMETRFVLGKVITDTMRGGITQCQTKLLSEKKDRSYASKVKLEQGEKRKPNSKEVKRKKQNYKGREKRRSDVPAVWDQQITKKIKQNKETSAEEEKLVKDKLGEMPSSQGTVKGEQQLKKAVVKDVKKHHSLQKETTKPDDKVKIGWHCESQNPKEIHTIVKKVSMMTKQPQTLDPNEILRVLEKVPNMGRQYNAQASEQTLNVLRHTHKILKQHKDQAPVEMLNVLNPSNISKGNEDPNKKHSKPEKQAIMEEQCRDESKKKRKTQKLSGLFK